MLSNVNEGKLNTIRALEKKTVSIVKLYLYMWCFEQNVVWLE